MAWEIFEPVASRYDTWYESDKGRRVDRAERALLDWMLERIPGTRTVLDVGCGTGHFSRYLTSRSLQVVGADRSPAMLAASRKGNPKIVGVLADAHRLPFRDRAADAVVFVTSFEFMDEPRGVLAEAVRVSRHGVMLVALNSRSLGGLSRRVGPQSSQPILGRAWDNSVGSLRRALRSAAGERLRSFHWRYGCYPHGLWPTPSRLPGGDVIAMAAVLTS